MPVFLLLLREYGRRFAGSLAPALVQDGARLLQCACSPCGSAPFRSAPCFLATPRHGNPRLKKGSTVLDPRVPGGGVKTTNVIKKRQQEIVGFLEANRIPFEVVDITMLEDQRLWMYRNLPEGKHPDRGNPLPPQIFNGQQYCGDYEDFFQSKETNTVFSFLGLPSKGLVKDSES
ncbi:SH3 domain-binding glutamic acid-rich-like protein 2 isoform X1 [Paramormyrops kingsleyae]|uniref:SH3 domain-binding glutamic acid-rich-like protein 2 isoform X1 n=1 Tax=Paramormyrops kingsleyae TaxID=1676925 RepID=UPI000CD63E9E|nr:SH3 domain-binding glutamic acid-rich-like protein 2 isoform X1 [Paramormyrops kingsleyae]